MQSDLAPHTDGTRFAADALPLPDLETGGADFEIHDCTVLLKGSVSRSSGSRAFPMRQVCLETGARDMEPMTFGPKGTLYSYTTVRVSSARPVPYTIGYVDFDNGVRVLAQVEAGSVPLGCDHPVEVRAEGERWFVVPVANDNGGAA